MKKKELNLTTAMYAFWNFLRVSRPVTSMEADVYCYILMKANTERWQSDVVEFANAEIQGVLNLNPDQLNNTRKSLTKKGYIQYIPGKGRTKKPSYVINFALLGIDFGGKSYPQKLGSKTDLHLLHDKNYIKTCSTCSGPDGDCKKCSKKEVEKGVVKQGISEQPKKQQQEQEPTTPPVPVAPPTEPKAKKTAKSKKIVKQKAGNPARIKTSPEIGIPVVAAYYREKYKHWSEATITDQSNAFYNYHASKGWMIGKNPMKDWQAAARTWAGNADKWGHTQPKQEPQTSTSYGGSARKARPDYSAPGRYTSANMLA